MVNFSIIECSFNSTLYEKNFQYGMEEIKMLHTASFSTIYGNLPIMLWVVGISRASHFTGLRTSRNLSSTFIYFLAIQLNKILVH